jgi:hypothetical protein
VADPVKKTPKRGRPAKPDALTAVERQAAYRKKKLEEGIEISLFLTHNQAAILRNRSKKAAKTQSEFIGELLEKSEAT